MFPILSCILLIFLGLVHTQSDPRKRYSSYSNDDFNTRSKDEFITCSRRMCLKRASPSSQEEQLVGGGPFWANRGKKDPRYYDERMNVKEPYFVLIRKDSNSTPFFTSRGKKAKFYDREPRRVADDNDIGDPAFYAARGKKMQEE